jgi:hypothetical protein
MAGSSTDEYVRLELAKRPMAELLDPEPSPETKPLRDMNVEREPEPRADPGSLKLSSERLEASRWNSENCEYEAFKSSDDMNGIGSP